jgi:hypothetical protein
MFYINKNFFINITRITEDINSNSVFNQDSNTNWRISFKSKVNTLLGKYKLFIKKYLVYILNIFISCLLQLWFKAILGIFIILVI